MIILEKVSKVFKTKNRSVKAIDGISLAFPSSGIVFLVGESGAGKSTLLNLISLQDTPSSGSILLDGNDVSKLKESDLSTLRNTYFGIMFQDNNLIDDFSVYQNLEFALRLQGKTYSKEKAADLLNSIGLASDILDEKPANLSGGQRQRISFLRSILKGSEAIICDEPTGSLDEKNAKDVMDLLKAYSKSKLVIVVSHDVALAKEYADRVIKISSGRVVEDSAPSPFLSGAQSEEKKNLTSQKPHLPFQSQFFFASHSFKGLIGKTIIAFFSLFVTLTVLIGTCSLSLYDSSKAIKDAIATNEIDYVMMRKYETIYANSAMGSYFVDEDIPDLKRLYGNDYLLANGTRSVMNSPSSNGGSFQMHNCVSINEENSKNFNLDIIGALPQSKASGMNDEIMLTSYECYLFGWISEDEMDDVAKLQAIAAEKTYKIKPFDLEEAYVYSISGIVDTHYSLPDSENEDQMYKDNQSAKLASELHLSLFFPEADYNLFVEIDSRGSGYAADAIYCATINDSYFKTDQLSECINARQSGFFAKNSSLLDPSIATTDEFMKTTKDVFLVATFVFLLIYVFSFASFIKTSVANRIPAMKTLKSLGIDNLHIYSIFLLQSALITAASLFVSTFAYLGLVLGYSSYLAGTYHLITPLSFNFLIVLACFLASLLFSSLLVYLFSFRLFKSGRIR